MTDGIGKLTGFGNYGVGGYAFRKGDDVNKNQTKEEAVVNNYAETQVDPAKVMDFLANNKLYVATPKAVNISGVDKQAEDRVGGYMEQFEMIYSIVQKEFGEELAPAVMDMVMDRLMGMAA